MRKSTVEIGERSIGPRDPVLVVAELSANHAGSLDRALRVVRAAAEAGADAIKLQTYTPETMTIDCGAPPFVVGPGSPWEGWTLYDLYSEAQTPWEWHEPLQMEAERLGLLFLSTPFDKSAVEFLESLEVPAYKIASFEITDLELIRRVAMTGRPIILSTGMATLAEIEEACDVARSAGATDIVLLGCTSAYPAPPEEMNLAGIPLLAETFGMPVGLSDHTLGTAVAVAAVALGACLVEKHVCLSREEGGPDSAFSLEPEELGRLVRDVRTARAAVGRPEFGCGGAERGNRVFRRSVFAVKDVRAGELLTDRNVRVIRPGHGLAPRFLPQVLGRLAATDIPCGTPIVWEHLGAFRRRD